MQNQEIDTNKQSGYLREYYALVSILQTRLTPIRYLTKAKVWLILETHFRSTLN